MDSALNVGMPAPDFNLPDQDENLLTLNDFIGKWLVLYFYPKDNTSGCTLEAQEFTDRIADFNEQNADVLGISPDSCQSHRRFIDKKELGIRLLSDQEHTMLEAYGCWKLKKMYGKEYFGVIRSTFIINPNGIIAAMWTKVKVKRHVDSVYDKLKELVVNI